MIYGVSDKLHVITMGLGMALELQCHSHDGVKSIVVRDFPSEFAGAVLQALGSRERTFFDFSLSQDPPSIPLSWNGRIAFFPEGDPMYVISLVYKGRGYLVHMETFEMVQLLTSLIGLIR